jgi:hypothetical protein
MYFYVFDVKSMKKVKLLGYAMEWMVSDAIEVILCGSYGVFGGRNTVGLSVFTQAH